MPKTIKKIPSVTMGNGHTVPQVGLGLWKIKSPGDFNRAFNAAVGAGYRHFDSAQAYGNEQLLGEACKKSGLKREDLFITTKILTQRASYQQVLDGFEISLQKLQTEYVDLLLLHFPGVPWQRKGSWQALEEIKSAGKARSIGVSNYSVKHLEAMQAYAHEMPMVNQIELHIFLQRPELVAYCRKHNITIEAYSPLAHARSMDQPVIADIAAKHAKTYAQIMLRWSVQQDFVVLPKSVTPERIRENIGIFNFSLDRDDMRRLAKLNRNLHTLWHSIVFG